MNATTAAEPSAESLIKTSKDAKDLRFGPRTEVQRPTGERLDEILKRVRDATNRREAAKQEMHDAEENFRVEVRDALRAKVPVGKVMKETGLSETRAYQIRDGVRR